MNSRVKEAMMKNLKILSLLIFIGLVYSCDSDKSVLQKVGGEQDSLLARNIFREVPPTSNLWTKEHNRIPGAHYIALNTFGRIAEASGRPDTAAIYRQQIYEQHPDSSVRAAFLYSSVRDAYKAGEDKKLARLYKQLIDNYKNSYYAKRAREYAPNRAIQKGKQIPSFSFVSIEDSSKIITSEGLKGKMYLMDFWGTWCSPCVDNMEHLHELNEQYKDDGLHILSISLHDKEGAVERFREEKWPMPWMNVQINDDSKQEEETVEKFEAISFPNYILINKDGEIIATTRDLRNKEGEIVMKDILNRVLDIKNSTTK